MEKACTSSVLMGALTVGLIIADYYFNRTERVLTHIFLGSITTILFYALCSHGYEMINWVFLAILPVYVFFSLLSIYLRTEPREDISDTCDSCGESVETCGCDAPLPKPIRKPKSSDCGCNKKPEGCPVNPIKLNTECGISRYS